MKNPPDEIKKLISYNPETGIFTRVLNGKQFNGKTRKGYVFVTFNGKMYYAHRLAYWWIHGKMPDNQIDHINQIKDDNRILNLRDVNCTENNRNNKRVKQGDYIGVLYKPRYKNNPWEASGTFNGIKKYLGHFRCKHFAAQVVLHYETYGKIIKYQSSQKYITFAKSNLTGLLCGVTGINERRVFFDLKGFNGGLLSWSLNDLEFFKEFEYFDCCENF